MIGKFIAGFCVATVITQLVVAGALAARGTFTGETALKMMALVNGIDISGDHLQRVIENAEASEAPSFEEVLEQRAAMGLDIDLRLQSQTHFYDHLQTMLRQLKEREQRFDVRREAFNKKLDDIEKGIRDEGMLELQRTLEVLDPELAKAQLEMAFDDGEIDTVVNIVQAMPPDKRKKILGEFVGADENKKLYEILRRIGEGEPKQSLIEQAREDTGAAPAG